MQLGVPREVKQDEHRVGLTPAAVAQLSAAGHQILVERGAGEGSAFDDGQYQQAGGKLVDTAAEVYAKAELIVKVKEPQQQEYPLLRPSQLLLTYLHLAAAPELARELMASQVTAIGYETVCAPDGSLPLLTPMSEIAGRMSVQAGAHHLERTRGGRGALLGQVGGVPAGQVLIVGGGVVGAQAASVALGMGARVTILDKSLARLRQLEDKFAGRAALEFASQDRLRELAACTDLLIGAVLVPGAAAPRLLTRDDIATMRPGSVLVDVAIDQGGCFATSRPTTHAEPTYTVNEVIHYCVANIPSAVARTSTMALCHATLPYVRTLADRGWAGLCSDPALRSGVNVHGGRVTHREVAESLGESYQPIE